MSHQPNVTFSINAQAESKRFEQEVIAGGPVILPGVKQLLEQVSPLHNYTSFT